MTTQPLKFQGKPISKEVSDDDAPKRTRRSTEDAMRDKADRLRERIIKARKRIEAQTFDIVADEVELARIEAYLGAG